MAWFILLAFSGVGLIHPLAAGNAGDIEGQWYTDGEEAIIEIYEKDGAYYGKIAWMEEPFEADGNWKVDDQNPDESLRNRPILDLEILKGFQYEGDQKWSNGEIYDPESGRTYSCHIRMVDDKLKVRGYVGFSALGRTETWTSADD